MVVRAAAVVLFLATLSPFAFAQSDSTKPSTGKIVLSDAGSYFTDAGTVFTAPLHFNESQWLTTGAVLGGTALLFTADNTVRAIAQRNQGTFGNNFFNIGRHYGNPDYGLALSGGMYIWGLAGSDRQLKQSGIALFESISFASAITLTIKSLAGRSRPFTGEGNIRFHGFELNDDYLSLPSGDVTVAFSVSSALSEELHNTYASIGLYSLGVMIMAERIYYDQHWVSDTFLGAAIGTSIGLTVTHLHDNDSGAQNISLVPAPSGIGVVWVF
jgi:membrane-associated phospholipid phosphatase